MQTSNIKYFFLILIILIISNCSVKDRPKVIKGVIDLSYWDFKRDGILKLKGEWDFKWLPETTKIEEINLLKEWDKIEVPGYWNQKTGSGTGYSLYRLRIKSNREKKLTLYIRSVMTAFTLYIENEIIIKGGTFGINKQKSVPNRLPLSKKIEVNDDFTIMIIVSNYHHARGGINISPVIGLDETIFNHIWFNDFFVILALGIILMMSIYHFLLWTTRKRGIRNLVFSLFCFVIFCRSFVTNYYFSRFLQFVNYQKVLFEISYKVDYLSITLGCFFFLYFFYYLFSRYFNKAILKIFILPLMLLSFFTIFSYATLYARFLIVFQVILILTNIYTLYVLIIAWFKKDKESHIVLIAAIIFFIFLIAEITYLNSEGNVNINFIHFGLLYLIFSQSYILSKRFSRAYKTARYLSHNLQKEVEKKTDKIREQNEEIIKVSEQKTNFFINLAHETKTPLTLISNYLDKYLKKQNNSYELDIIKSNIDKLKRDMVNFLDIEKLERGQLFYNHDQIVNITKVLKTAILLFREIANNKKIKIIDDISDKDIFIRIDPYAIDRVINNILENAIRYTDADGEVHAILKNIDKKKVGLTISDTGIGISEKKLEHIFESYYQISHKKRNIQGIGVGLSIVKKIIDQVDGDIKIDSRVNEGTTFKIIFKSYELSEDDAVEDDIEYLEPVKVVSFDKLQEEKFVEGKYNILIIEDNIHLLAYLQDSLQSMYNVYYAKHGEEALKKLEYIPKPKIIISDILMDVMDGYEFYKKLLDNKKYKDIPLIFLTAKTTIDEKLEGLYKGAIDYIYKPFNINELLAKIDSIIKNQESLRESNITEMEYKIAKALRVGEDYDKNINFNYNCDKYDLSLKEREIIKFLIDGLEYKEISAKLKSSINTIKKRIQNIYKKLGVHNKVDLIKIINTKVE